MFHLFITSLRHVYASPLKFYEKSIRISTVCLLKNRMSSENNTFITIITLILLSYHEQQRSMSWLPFLSNEHLMLLLSINFSANHTCLLPAHKQLTLSFLYQIVCIPTVFLLIKLKLFISQNTALPLLLNTQSTLTALSRRRTKHLGNSNFNCKIWEKVPLQRELTLLISSSKSQVSTQFYRNQSRSIGEQTDLGLDPWPRRVSNNFVKRNLQTSSPSKMNFIQYLLWRMKHSANISHFIKIISAPQ